MNDLDEGSVAQWIRHLTKNYEGIPGSRPGGVAVVFVFVFFFFLLLN